MNQWYYAEGQDRKGPVDEATLQALAVNEVVTPETLVWRQGMAEWQPYQSISELSPGPAASTPPPTPPVSSEPTPTSAVPSSGEAAPPPAQSIELGGQTVTTENKAAYVQQLQEGINPSGQNWRYGGFWIRFAALMIDSVFTTILTYSVIIPIAFILGGSIMSVLDSTGDESLGIVFFIFFMLVGIAIPAVYYTWTTGSKMQGTFGKKLVGLRVIREDGGDITYLHALGRYFGFFLSSIILYIGLIMAAFDDQKRTLHDHLCGTRVIER